MAASDRRTALSAHHCGAQAGACCAVVQAEGCIILIDLTVEQAASQREIKHLPLTWTRQKQRHSLSQKSYNLFTLILNRQEVFLPMHCKTAALFPDWDIQIQFIRFTNAGKMVEMPKPNFKLLAFNHMLYLSG